jgi:hypothetical protein
LIQSRLIDRRLAFAQHLDFALVNINTGYRMSQISQARSRDQPHVAGSDNTYFHLLPPKKYASDLEWGKKPFGEMMKRAGPSKAR